MRRKSTSCFHQAAHTIAHVQAGASPSWSSWPPSFSSGSRSTRCSMKTHSWSRAPLFATFTRLWMLSQKVKLMILSSLPLALPTWRTALQNRQSQRFQKVSENFKLRIALGNLIQTAPLLTLSTKSKKQVFAQSGTWDCMRRMGNGTGLLALMG